MLSKTLKVFLAAVVILYVCFTFLLPERFAVNMPFRLLQVDEEQESLLQKLKLPDGFQAEVFARDINRVRFMQLTERGDLVVTLPKDGQVVLLKADQNGDGKNDGRTVLLTQLKLPHGIDIYNGWLYIAETHAVGRIRFDAELRGVFGDYQRIIEGIPESGNHWTRSLRFGPDNLLYLSIGSSCNVCVESDERRAAILRFNPDGSGQELLATGLRNSVGFDWSPMDKALYATDNGRDLLGDDFPPDELNKIVKNGFYGWPFANGNKIPDPDYGEGQNQNIQRSIAPVHQFRAHNAPLGVTFLRSKQLPIEYQSSALVALHGSWNRSKKDGYKVVSLHQLGNGKFKEKDFMTGFEDDEKVIGRPVDIVESKEGDIYISDDYSGIIYHILWHKN